LITKRFMITSMNFLLSAHELMLRIKCK
jgi:hypothetical protein